MYKFVRRITQIPESELYYDSELYHQVCTAYDGTQLAKITGYDSARLQQCLKKTFREIINNDKQEASVQLIIEEVLLLLDRILTKFQYVRDTQINELKMRMFYHGASIYFRFQGAFVDLPLDMILLGLSVKDIKAALIQGVDVLAQARFMDGEGVLFLDHGSADIKGIYKCLTHRF